MSPRNKAQASEDIEMISNLRPESAKIYQFPAKRADVAAAQRSTAKPVADRKSLQFGQVEFGSAWYHEAAMQEADQTRKS